MRARHGDRKTRAWFVWRRFTRLWPFDSMRSRNDALPMSGRRSEPKCPCEHMHSDRNDRLHVESKGVSYVEGLLLIASSTVARRLVYSTRMPFWWKAKSPVIVNSSEAFGRKPRKINISRSVCICSRDAKA